MENTVTSYKNFDQIRMPTGRETFAHKDECGWSILYNFVLIFLRVQTIKSFCSAFWCVWIYILFFFFYFFFIFIEFSSLRQYKQQFNQVCRSHFNILKFTVSWIHNLVLLSALYHIWFLNHINLTKPLRVCHIPISHSKYFKLTIIPL